MKDRCEFKIGKIILVGICKKCGNTLDDLTEEDFEDSKPFDPKDGIPITFDKNEPMCDECRTKTN